MSPILPTRRAALAALLAAPLALRVGAAAALTPGGVTISAVRIDTAPLRAIGAGAIAARLAQVLPAEFAAVFGPVLAPGRGGATLVAVVKEVFLQSYVGGEDDSFSSTNDFITGEALLVDARGGVLARAKIVANRPSSSGGAWYLPGAETRRVDLLGQSFAYWSRRELGL